MDYHRLSHSRINLPFMVGIVVTCLHFIHDTGVVGVSCPFITLPARTNRTSDATHVGAQVTWFCIEIGDAFNDESSTTLQVTCRPSGSWNPPPHACRPRRCGPSPLVDHSSVITENTAAMSIQQYKCFFGYAFADNAVSKYITCDSANLEWDNMVGREPVIGNITCKQSFCPDLPEDLETVYFEGDRFWENGTGIPVGYYINGYCKDGYQKGNDILQSARCGAARRYDITFGECSPMTCELYSIMNTTRSNDNSEYRLRTKWSCPPNTMFPDGLTEIQATCNNVGQWSIEPPTSGCTGGACDAGWLLFDQNCYLISDIESFGLRYWAAQQSCVYKNSHLVTIMNADENSWLYKRTSALGRDFWIGYYRISRSSDVWKWTSGSNTNYTKWWRGYPEINNCGRISVKGVWKDRDCDDSLPYVCKKPAKCSSPPIILNGRPTEIVNGSMDVGDSILFQCDTGYSFPNDGETTRLVTCMEGAYFSSIDNCQRTKCPPISRFGYHVRNAMPNTQDNTYLTNVTWTCRSGFIYPDGSFSKVMMCQKDRTWTPTPPMCIKAKCPIPAAQNADPQYSMSEVAKGDTYTCHRGYEFADGTTQKNFMCYPDGQWVPQANCQRKACDEYVQIDGKITNTTSIDPDSPLFGDVIEVTCDPGFLFPDGETVKNTECGNNYRWNPYLPSCDALQCPGTEPPAVQNAIANTTADTAKTVVLYTCVGDFVFVDGKNTRVAFCDGKTLEWSNVPLSCYETVPERNGRPMGVPMNISTLIGTLAIVLLALLIFVSICAVCHEGRKQFGICQISCELKEVEEEEIDEEEETRNIEMHQERRFTMVS